MRALKAAFALGAVMACSCVIAPDINEKPPETLYAPEIDTTSMYPAFPPFFTLSKDCPSVTFKPTKLKDRNRKDTLYVRWFFDWRPENRYDALATYTVFPSGQEERAFPDNARKILSSSEYPATDVNGYSRVQTLSIFVFDRVPDPSPGTNGVQFPPGSDGLFTSYTWVFQVTPDGDCPASPP